MLPSVSTAVLPQVSATPTTVAYPISKTSVSSASSSNSADETDVLDIGYATVVGVAETCGRTAVETLGSTHACEAVDYSDRSAGTVAESKNLRGEGCTTIVAGNDTIAVNVRVSHGRCVFGGACLGYGTEAAVADAFLYYIICRSSCALEAVYTLGPRQAILVVAGGGDGKGSNGEWLYDIFAAIALCDTL